MSQNVFDYRNAVINEYSCFSRSFAKIQAADIKKEVDAEYDKERYWPKPLIQINPNYQVHNTVDDLCDKGVLSPKCRDIFRGKKNDADKRGKQMSLYLHQTQAISLAAAKQSYVVTTGTGSGKSLSFFIPIVDSILRAKAEGKAAGTSAIIIYPMNALANSQMEEINKFLLGCEGSFTVARYTGQDSAAEREAIANNPPDILLTNYMMMELILTRGTDVDKRVMEHCAGLKFLVLDELHTYRGRQGADVALLVRRLRRETKADGLVCIGTSATMDNTGSDEQQICTVAKVASKIFGAEIKPSNVITETLAQLTDEHLNLAKVKPLLASRIGKGIKPFTSIEEFRKDPLSVWVELTLGIEKPDTGKAKRAKPITLREAAEKLSMDSGVSQELAEDTLQKYLMAAHALESSDGRKPFAFKLHQFISGPGSVLCTLEPEGRRHVTLDAQVYAPGRKEQGVKLFNAHFCRECGAEFFPVRYNEDLKVWEPRDIGEAPTEDNAQTTGFLVPRKEAFKYQTEEDVPESWWELDKDGNPRIKKDLRPYKPRNVYICADGTEEDRKKDENTEFYFIPGKIRFCPSCGFEHKNYGADRNKLTGLSGEGRSSATTILTLAVLNQLFRDNPYEVDPENDVRKMLGFTDNRQDAALQAGHFNDFVFTATLRAALLGALEQNGNVLPYDRLAEAVFKALGFDSPNKTVLKEYMVNPKMDQPKALENVKGHEKFVLGYRLMDELSTGWRNNNPSLEMLGLLHIEYQGLEGLCNDESRFADNEQLSCLSPAQRLEFYHILLRIMKEQLCIDSIYLKKSEQQTVMDASYRNLLEKWGFAYKEQPDSFNYVDDSGKKMGRGQGNRDYSTVSIGRNSQISKAIKNASLWSNTPAENAVRAKGSAELIRNIVVYALDVAQTADIVHKTTDGWQIHANAMQWCLNGVPDVAESGKRSNKFFETLYKEIKKALLAAVESDECCYIYEYSAHEHTAQVDDQERKKLEYQFRYTKKDLKEWKDEQGEELKRLPVLYCSPTMELGVDISSLNTVYMRNVPPTASNYAQRSGRAGRSGQPALVMTYSSSMSPHDQWFFNKRKDMVSGIVNAPTLDITNRDLLTSHIHSIWLQELDYNLGDSIFNNVMDPNTEPALELNQELKQRVEDAGIKERAKVEAKAVMAEVRRSLPEEERSQPWVQDNYVDFVMDGAAKAFNAAFDGWRTLYRSIQAQMDEAHKISSGGAYSSAERKNAERRHQEAQQQLNVLLGSSKGESNDFYPYRYLASQGFLPGYDFPRLPLMAWIPSINGNLSGKKENAGSMVSRPRFLAISEFGPQSIIYHEGRRFKVYKAKLNSGDGQTTATEKLATKKMIVCSCCGYGHERANVERCENCGQALGASAAVDSLYRIETVETRATTRISANEEERLRKGYELQTVYRFAEDNKTRCFSQSNLNLDGELVGKLTYGPNAKLWVLNLGWRKRKNMSVKGFNINPMTGCWESDPGDTDTPDQVDTDNTRVAPQRIVPFVEDTKNILIYEPVRSLMGGKCYSLTTMATIASALQRAIEEEFQIEQSELAVKMMPSDEACTSILFYESSEGGAGVLTELVRNTSAMSQVACRALSIMHYTWDGIDGIPGKMTPPKSVEMLQDTEKDASNGCVSGCYRCLLSYYNQPQHGVIDRRDPDTLEILLGLANASVDKVDTPAELVEQSGAEAKTLQEILGAIGCINPDEYDKSIMNDSFCVKAYWKTSRFVLVESEPDAGVANYLSSKGFRYMVIGTTPDEWENVLNENKKQLPGCEEDDL